MLHMQPISRVPPRAICVSGLFDSSPTVQTTSVHSLARPAHKSSLSTILRRRL